MVGISKSIRKPKENIGFRDKPEGMDKQKYKKTIGKHKKTIGKPWFRGAPASLSRQA